MKISEQLFNEFKEAISLSTDSQNRAMISQAYSLCPKGSKIIFFKKIGMSALKSNDSVISIMSKHLGEQGHYHFKGTGLYAIDPQKISKDRTYELLFSAYIDPQKPYSCNTALDFIKKWIYF